MTHDDLFNFVFSYKALVENLNAQKSADEWMKLLDGSLQETHYTKGQVLQRLGQIPDHISFLQKGAVNAYYYDDGGKKCSFYLWNEPAIVTDIVNFVSKTPSDLYIEVCEFSQLITVTRSALENIMLEFPEAAIFLTGILFRYSQHHKERDRDSMSLTAEQRLAKLLKENRKIEQKFSRDCIASYLGMSRSWLYNLKGKR